MFKNNKDLNYQIKQVIDLYSYVDEFGERAIDFNAVPDIEMDELYALAISDDKVLAYEACGPDNNSFDGEMLPSLINMLMKSKREVDQDFVNSWKKGVRSYLKKSIQSLINEEIDRQNTYFPLRENHPYSEMYL